MNTYGDTWRELAKKIPGSNWGLEQLAIADATYAKTHQSNSIPMCKTMAGMTAIVVNGVLALAPAVVVHGYNKITK